MTVVCIGTMGYCVINTVLQLRKYVPCISSPVTTVPVFHAAGSVMEQMTVVMKVTNKQNVVVNNH